MDKYLHFLALFKQMNVYMCTFKYMLINVSTGALTVYYNKTVYFKFIAFLNRRVSSPVYDWLVLTCVDEPARRTFTELFGLVGKCDLYNSRKLSSRGLNTNGMWRNKLKRHQNESVQAPMNNKIDNYDNKWNSISINFGHI